VAVSEAKLFAIVAISQNKSAERRTNRRQPSLNPDILENKVCTFVKFNQFYETLFQTIDLQD